jgi:DNA/RNA-binding domain of Phe-tRNA-synthetase-like protein
MEETVNLTIDQKLKEVVPGLTLGCVTASVKVEKHSPDLWSEINAHVSALSAELTSDNLTELPPVKAIRDAYKSIGKDPSRYRGAAEALLRRIVAGKGLYRINNVVDVNNLVSLRTKHPVGSYDCGKLAPPVIFRVGLPGESYKGIGKDFINVADLPLLADERGPFGSPTSDSERAMIRPETRDLLMVVMSFAGAGDIPEALDQASDLLRRYASADDVQTQIVE